jgi:hypothetical protein
VTAAPGLQPADSRLEANDPEVPNVAPDSTASVSPALLIDPRGTALSDLHLRRVMSKAA